MNTTDQLQQDLDRLEQRLEDGERRIKDATAIGADTDAWERFWIELLHQYEAMYRRVHESDQDGRSAA